jgi:hypothetical protein
MEVTELRSASFIVRIWLEAWPTPTEPAVWRGLITHVPSAQKAPILDLDDIITFVRPHLEQLCQPPRPSDPPC